MISAEASPGLAIDFEAAVGTLDLRVKLPLAAGVTVVVGPNGAGKSTLLLGLLGAVDLSRGEIRLGGEILYSDRRGIDVPIEERRLGYVPQRYALFPHMTVAENVAFGIRAGEAERSRRVAALLADLEIAHLAARRPATLSGGESQRVALARALAIGPRALLLDEPTAALDIGARSMVRALLADRLAAIDVPTLVVSHDLQEVEALAGRVAVIESGSIVQVGSLGEVRADPATPFAERFFAGQKSIR